ncbi:unnamed protein product [Rotaria socialis]|uniref:Integrase catalytic domain-containing protein n=2 Tax=Rotaria socialis TaxID=392032 RepID=A0A818KI05_9BILA|nr:unnamed protein product [Rotaria socialis]CAF4520647.1 unnamed protein product [Rotaria socialis]
MSNRHKNGCTHCNQIKRKFQSNYTTVQIDSGELIFYKELEQHINSLSEKFRIKSVIRQIAYNDIVKCLLLPKGVPLELFGAKFIFWVKQHFILIKIANVEIGCCIKSKKPICVYEAYYNVIGEAHVTISHGGRDKTIYELNTHYRCIPRFAVEMFLKQCVPCQIRKPLKQHVIGKPIISLGVMTRLQIDLIDMRTRPDILKPDIIYNWILNCIDHFSKFSWSYPLKNKSAAEVALKLRELFFVFGPQRLLHSDNGREFVAKGWPRHPQSQGCVERANGVLCSALGKWMTTYNSSPWSDDLLPVIYENGIVDEENLPTPICDSNDDIIDDENDCADVIDEDIIQLVQQLSDEVVASSLVDLSLSHSPTVTPQKTRHDLVRKIATDNYLNAANKKMKHYQASIISEAKKFNLNDCVGLQIHTVDRTNTDAKLLPCLIIEKLEKDGKITFILACEYGKLKIPYSIEHVVDLKMACPEALKHIVINDLNDITFIEACKLYVRTSTTGRACDCKGKCATKQCSCKKMGVFCSTKCHSKRGGCANMGE